MKLGFIGAGNMAQAIIGGIIDNGFVSKSDIIASAATNETINKVSEKFGIETTLDNKETATADILFLSVKPVYYKQVIDEIKNLPVKDSQIIITVAAGKTIEWVEDAFGDMRKIVRTMPNTPALVGEGITAVCPNSNITEEELVTVLSLLETFGKAEVVKESMMDAVVAVSGSSPAYVFMFIEAMADAASSRGYAKGTGIPFCGTVSPWERKDGA